MKNKFLVIGFIAASIIASVLAFSITLAQGERWFWEGNNELRASGGIFGNGVKFESSNGSDSTKPKFKMSGGSNLTIEYACKGDPSNRERRDDLNNDKTCKTDGPSDGATRCKNSNSGDCKDVFIMKCTLTALEVQVNESDNTVSQSSMSNTSAVVKDDVHERAGSRDGMGVDIPKCIKNISYGKIANKRGGNAADTTVNEGLDKEKNRLVKEYIKQKCGDHPTPECERNARQAFETIFQSCVNDTDTIAVTDGAGAQSKVDSIANCVRSSTGLELDTEGVMNAVLIVPDYVEEKASCSLELIGWIICPVARFMGSVADYAFGALENLLQIQPLNRGTEGGDSLYKAWGLMRNLANVLFVIAFMFVIYSQLTGFGLDNYGIKKLLPRIIIAAVLVNASFYIAIIIVDFTNIVGHSLYTFLHDYANSLNPTVKFEDEDGWSKIIESVLVPTGIATVGAVIVTTTVLYASFSALVPLLTTVILSLFTAIAILVGRYAFIIILIIVAPLAFVAYLLPNTQKWYNMWQKTFVGLLMLYPIIGIIYGGSYLAGLVVMNSAGGSTGVQSNLLQLFGLSLTAIPLLLTPIIMKFGGGILNRFGGRVRSNGLFKKANQKAEGYAERKKDQRDLRALQLHGDKKRGGIGGLRDGAVRRRYKKDAIRSARAGQLTKAQSGYISDYTSSTEGSGGDKLSLLERAKAGYKNYGMQEDHPDYYTPKTKGEQYAAGLAKGSGEEGLNRAIASAVDQKMSAHYEGVATAKEMFAQGYDIEALKQIATGNNINHTSDAERQAALEIVAEQRDTDIDDIVKSAGSMNGQLRYALARSVQKNGNSALYSNPTAIKAIMNGGTYNSSGQLEALDASTFHKQIVAPSVNEGTLTASQLADSEHETIADINTAIDQGHITGDAAAGIAAQASRTLDNRYTKERATGSTRPELERLSNRGPRT